MIVRDEQLKAFAAQDEIGYAESAADHLERFDPVLAAAAGRERLEEAAKIGLQDARRHDLTAGPALQLYLETMSSLGSGFDADPQFRWLRPFLDPRKDMGAVERARFLHFHTSAYMTRAYGASNEFARAAAERARDQLARFTRPGAGVEIAPMDLLKWLHPERLDFVDSAAASELGGEARKCASAVGFPLPQGVNLLLILMFIFGAEVASDPLYHWVGELLQGPEPGADRLNNLVDRTKEHLAAILAASKEVAS